MFRVLETRTTLFWSEHIIYSTEDGEARNFAFRQVSYPASYETGDGSGKNK